MSIPEQCGSMIELFPMKSLFIIKPKNAPNNLNLTQIFSLFLIFLILCRYWLIISKKISWWSSVQMTTLWQAVMAI